MELPIREVEYEGVQIAFDAFDTANFITLYQAADAASLLEEAKSICFRLDRLWNFSNPESDIARINAAGTERVAVAAETADLLAAAATINAAEPLFDITIGPVTSLWKHAAAVPDEHVIAGALEHTGTGKLDIGAGWVRKTDPMLRVDVGGIAKGYIADRLAAWLQERGVFCADIDLGGNLYLSGEHPQGRAWRIESELPEGFPGLSPRFLVQDASVSTSSNFLRAERIDGVEYGHIIDPASGFPVQTDIAMATVISQRSLLADALSTVVLASGSAGFACVAQRHEDCALIALTKDGCELSANLPCEFAYLVR